MHVVPIVPPGCIKHLMAESKELMQFSGMHSSEVKANFDNVVPPGWKLGFYAGNKAFTYKVAKKLLFWRTGVKKTVVPPGCLTAI